jgi:hypothetical protein
MLSTDIRIRKNDASQYIQDPDRLKSLFEARVLHRMEKAEM